LRRPIALLWTTGFLLCAATQAFARAKPLVLASEAVYADIARQIGGDRIVLHRLDPHHKQWIAAANIVLLNGGELDAVARKSVLDGRFKGKILEAKRFSTVIGPSTPYYWYDFKGMRGLAAAFAASLEELDPPNSAHYSHNLFRFDASMIPLSAKMKNLWKYYRKSTVLVTDNLFQPVLELLEFVIVDTAFEKENENRMALADGGAILRKDIAQKKASILVYDSEQQSPVLTKLVAMANQTGVPAVGVRKTKPASLSYQEWMIRELNALHGALNEAAQ